MFCCLAKETAVSGDKTIHLSFSPFSSPNKKYVAIRKNGSETSDVYLDVKSSLKLIVYNYAIRLNIIDIEYIF